MPLGVHWARPSGSFVCAVTTPGNMIAAAAIRNLPRIGALRVGRLIKAWLPWRVPTPLAATQEGAFWSFALVRRPTVSADRTLTLRQGLLVERRVVFRLKRPGR